MTKVFISYSWDSDEHKEKVWRLWENLRGLGLEVVLYQESDPTPLTWFRWCEAQVKESDYVLMIMTDTYARRIDLKEKPGEGLGATHEGNIIYQLLCDCGGKNYKFIPLVFSRADWAHAPVWLKGYDYYHVTDNMRRDKLIQKLGGAITTGAEKKQVKNLLNIPAKNPFFTGRTDILARLYEAAQKHTSIALTQTVAGLGGVGKSSIAVEYAIFHAKNYSTILWANADTTDTLLADCRRLLNRLGIAIPADPQTDLADMLKLWLEQNSSWLLVLDNADHPALLESIIPAHHEGHILITSRANESQFGAETVGVFLPLDKMNPDDAVAFLFKRAKRGTTSSQNETHTANELAKELWYFPLALEQAAAYMAKTKTSFEVYLSEYKKKGAALLKECAAPDCPVRHSVCTTWAMNIQEVEKASPAAAELLRAVAFLAPDAIPFSLLREGGQHLGPNLKKALSRDNPLAVKNILSLAQSFSLLNVDFEAVLFSMHRMVQEAIKLGMGEEEKRQWAERAVLAVNAAFPYVKFENWAACERLLPHALVCFEHIKKWGLESEEAGLVLNQAGGFHYERGRFAEAEPLFAHALEIKEKLLGPDHPSTATSLNNLAELYESQGKYNQAVPLYKRALKIRENVLGPDHPDTATSINNLAFLIQTPEEVRSSRLPQQTRPDNQEEIPRIAPPRQGHKSQRPRVSLRATGEVRRGRPALHTRTDNQGKGPRTVPPRNGHKPQQPSVPLQKPEKISTTRPPLRASSSNRRKRAQPRPFLHTHFQQQSHSDQCSPPQPNPHANATKS